LPHRRLLIALAVAGLALCAATAVAAPAATTPSVERGKAIHIDLTTRTTVLCSAVVKYSDGTVQRAVPKRARKGRLSWSLLVPHTAPLGAGNWHVHCGAKLDRTGRFTVVGTVPSTVPVEAPRVVIDKQGYSQRPDKYGTGSTVSLGLFLHNTSDTQDALNVYLLIDMVAADGQLVATKTDNVSLVSADQTYAYGTSMSLRTQAAVTKLEITVRIGSHQLKQSHLLPEFANVQILPNKSDAGWVGEVDGEVLNTAPDLTLRSANLSIVLLDAAGNPVGGGSASTSSPLPSGSRMVFLAQSGFNAVPLDRALTPVISVVPSYSTG
jgi:hypothetical protein